MDDDTLLRPHGATVGRWPDVFHSRNLQTGHSPPPWLTEETHLFCMFPNNLTCFYFLYFLASTALVQPLLPRWGTSLAECSYWWNYCGADKFCRGNRVEVRILKSALSSSITRLCIFKDVVIHTTISVLVYSMICNLFCFFSRFKIALFITYK